MLNPEEIEGFIEGKTPISVSLTKLSRERLIILMDEWQSNRSATINHAINNAYLEMMRIKKAQANNIIN